MIQRIQSVYWFVSVLLWITFFFVPFFHYGATGTEATFTIFGCKMLMGTVGVAAALTLVTIFLYNNRKLQIRLGTVLVVFNLAAHFFLWTHYYFLTQGQAPAEAGDVVKILPWVAIPTIILVLNHLAIRGVKRDEKLVRSADRLR